MHFVSQLRFPVHRETGRSWQSFMVAFLNHFAKSWSDGESGPKPVVQHLVAAAFGQTDDDGSNLDPVLLLARSLAQTSRLLTSIQA